MIVSMILTSLVSLIVGMFIGAYYCSLGWTKIAGMSYLDFVKAKGYVDHITQESEKIVIDFTDIDKLLEALEICEEHDSLDTFLKEEIYHEAMRLLVLEGEYEWMNKLKRIKDGSEGSSNTI